MQALSKKQAVRKLLKAFRHHRPLSGLFPFEPLEDRRLLSGGTLDPSFGSGGTVLTPFLGSRIDVAARSVALPDGRILVAGTSGNPSEEDFALARFNANGTPDTTFGVAGQVRTDLGAGDTVNDVTLQADGKILVAGMTGAGNDFAAAVVRYNANGSVDTTFGAHGIARVHPGTYDYAFAVRSVAGGKVVIGGYTGSATPNSGDFLLARLTPSGALDSTFGVGGITITDIAANTDVLRTLVVDGDRVIAAGDSIVGGPSSFHTNVVLARYNSAGKLDATFGVGGKVVVDAGGYETVADAILRPDGSILLADNFFGKGVVRQFKADGTADTAFGVAGRAALGVAETERVRRLALTTGGKILLGGTVGDGIYDAGDVALFRLNSNGALDRTYDGDGFAVTRRPGEQTLAGMTLRSDGAPVVAWSTGSAPFPEPNPNFDLARYTPAGALDVTFGAGGTASADFLSQVHAAAADVAVQPDGKLVAVGTAQAGTLLASQFIAIARYLPTGALDQTFGVGGQVQLTQGEPTRVFVRPDGRIIVAIIGTDQRTRFFQYLPNGKPDTTFGVNGVADPNLFAQRGGANILRLADGRLLIAGVSANVGPSTLAVVRMTADGKFDPSFGASGVATADLGDFSPYSIAVAPDGRVVVGGANFPTRTQPYNTQLALVRFLANGNLDTSFGNAGEVIVTSGPISNEAVAIAVQHDGSIVAASGADASAVHLTRFTPAGKLDTTFGVSAGATTLPFIASRVVLEPFDTILVSGATGPDALTVARFNSAGRPDTAFGANGVAKVTLPIFAVAGGLTLDNSNQIVIAGTGGGQFAVARLATEIQSPFGNAPITLPGVIEAENFDRGPDGIAYHDTSPNNVTGLYRPDTGVDLDVAKDTGGGYMIRSTQAGEWLEYSVNVPSSGAYAFDARVASFGEGGTFSVAVDGKTLLAPIAVPDTGGWQNWQTVTINGLPLTAGTHVLRINMLLIGRSGITGNFNWLQIRPTTGLPGLTATYYDTDAFSGVSFQRTVPNIDFNWDVGSPLAGIAPDTFSARFEGFLQAPATGDYTLYTRADDGVRLWIDNQILINDWTRHPATDRSATIHLQAGRKYALKLEYFEAYGYASLQLSWSTPSMSRQVIPATAFSTV